MTALLINRRQVLAGGAAVLAGGTAARAHNGTVHVTIDKLAFMPAQIEVRAGETIEWTNKDAFAHTATVRGGWEVMIPPGGKATRVTEAGDDVEYYCRFHPNMTGRITIIS